MKNERNNKLLEIMNETTDKTNKLIDDLDFTIVANINDSILKLYEELEEKDEKIKGVLVSEYLDNLKIKLELINYNITPIINCCSTLQEKLQAITFILSDVGRYINYKKGYYDDITLLNY